MIKEKKNNNSEFFENKKIAIESTLANLNKIYGNGCVMKLGEKPKITVETFNSGSMLLNQCLGGGYAKGRIIEIYGPESSGKTTFALHAIAEIQKTGGIAAFIDAEHALDPEYAKKIGVDIDNLIISQPDYGEQALEIVDALVRSGAVDLIVVDSVAALTPKAEIEGEMGDSHMGLQARLMSQALRKITGPISKLNSTVIFINQIRSKLGIMFGNPETTTGGNALKFYASQRIEIKRKDKIEMGTGDHKENIGNIVKVKVVKNKIAPPFKECELELIFNEGISKIAEIINIGVNKEIIKKTGAFYYFDEIKLGQGKENVKEFLKKNDDILKQIQDNINKTLFN